MPSVREVMTPANAMPRTKATARSIRFPRLMKSRNSLSKFPPLSALGPKPNNACNLHDGTSADLVTSVVMTVRPVLSSIDQRIHGQRAVIEVTLTARHEHF